MVAAVSGPVLTALGGVQVRFDGGGDWPDDEVVEVQPPFPQQAAGVASAPRYRVVMHELGSGPEPAPAPSLQRARSPIKQPAAPRWSGKENRDPFGESFAAVPAMAAAPAPAAAAAASASAGGDVVSNYRCELHWLGHLCSICACLRSLLFDDLF